MNALSDDDTALAAEYVLGLLDTATHTSAAARTTTDSAFAAEVGTWRERLLPLLDGADETPPDDIWGKVQSALPIATGQDTGSNMLRLWQGLTAVSASAAAALAAFLFLQPAAQTTPAAPPPLIAALGSDASSSAVTARFDSATGQLLITPVSLKTGELYPELWIIPADGKARSLGMVKNDMPTQVIVPISMRQYMDQGATLAITPEPLNGAPNGKATGPVIASGKIVSI